MNARLEGRHKPTTRRWSGRPLSEYYIEEFEVVYAINTVLLFCKINKLQVGLSAFRRNGVRIFCVLNETRVYFV